VVEVVRDNGTSVLNADDPLVAAMASHAEGRVMWFSRSAHNEIVKKHVQKGGRAAVIEQGVHGEMLTLYDGDRHIPVTWTHLIPATFEGKAKFNVENALAAAAIAYSLGASLEHLRQGLRTFTASFFQAPGRCNVFDEHPFRVIVDYGHNPAAMEKMVDFVRGLRKGRAIALLMAAGDRRDEDIRTLARVAAPGFDVFVLKEDDNLRGRAPGETAGLIREGLIAAGVAPERIVTQLAEPAAVEHALTIAEPGDLVVIFADDVTRTWKQVIYWGKNGEPRYTDDPSAAALARPFAIDALKESQTK
jgi:cyanophycin synthetase